MTKLVGGMVTLVNGVLSRVNRHLSMSAQEKFTQHIQQVIINLFMPRSTLVLGKIEAKIAISFFMHILNRNIYYENAA